MKRALLVSFVLSFGIFICSCTGNFGDLLGTSGSSNNRNPADTTGGPHGCDSLHLGHHGSDHDADDSTATGDTAVHTLIINRH